MNKNSVLYEILNIIRDGKEKANRLLKDNTTFISIDEVIVPVKEGESFSDTILRKHDDKDLRNSFIYGDNLYIMKSLINGEGCPSMKEKIDLIYIDPPFLSKTDYKAKITLPLKEELVTIEKFAYSDTWQEGIFSYLKMLCPRLLLMKELLSDKGSIYVHLDWHMVHYVKILMDEIFGEDMFLNEIIWSYKSGGASKKYFSRKHDTILLYSKTKDYIFNPQKEKSYNRGLKPYRFKGVKEYKDEIGWYTLVNMKDVWNIDMVGRTSKERVGYDTQKPEELLKRIILSSSEEGSIVADFFAGSGTTGVVAEKYNRKWILTDNSTTSYTTIKKRLINIKAEKFSYQALKDCELPKGGKLNIKSLEKFDIENGKENICIELGVYEIDINHVPIEKKYRDIVSQISKEDSLSLIDFISIDIDYDGKTFISKWQNFKDNSKYKIDSVIKLKVPKKDKRLLAIKIVDVFGFENEYILKV